MKFGITGFFRKVLRGNSFRDAIIDGIQGTLYELIIFQISTFNDHVIAIL